MEGARALSRHWRDREWGRVEVKRAGGGGRIIQRVQKRTMLILEAE